MPRISRAPNGERRTPTADAPLLDVRDFSVHYRIGNGDVRAVDRVDLSLAPGEAMGLVGESGCGKTTTAKGLLRLLPPNGRVASGSAHLSGRDLVDLSAEEMRKVRWNEASWISQAAMNALDPVYRVGDQIVEAMQAHIEIPRRKALDHAAELFRQVGIDPARLRAYPHEMSGGMKQRAVIAMALALDPQLIIADEPTTALDVVTQAQILARLGKLRREHGTALLFITHDISVVVQTCDTVAVMYAGRVMETGPVRDVFRSPFHPYTMGLRNAFPTLDGARRELISIPGAPPDLGVERHGCRFAERCPFAEQRCRDEEPELRDVPGGWRAACHFPERADAFREAAARNETWLDVAERLGERPGRAAQTHRVQSEGPLAEIRGLERHFPVGSSGPLAWLGVGERQAVRAVDGIDLEIRHGEILGLAGESGSGKTTTGETLVRLQRPTAGEIRIDGRDIGALRGAELRAFRKRVQMVFQDPYETLNPRFQVHDIVAEPLRIHGIGDEADRDARVVQALERAGLTPPETYLDRFPHELSGGQRQRIAIARAIVLEPNLVVADEPVSMLDVSIRAGVLNLLRRFRDESGISLVYVSHDLPTIRYVADRTAVMYLGEIVEVGPTERLVRDPKHPYTRLLLDASPEPDPDVEKPPLEARGEIPSAIDPPNGCRFHTRCPVATPTCGFEGRDVQALLASLRIRDDERDALGPARRDGLDVIIQAPLGTEAAAREIEALMREERPAMAEAATVAVDRNAVRVRFEAVPSPQRLAVADDHEVACVLYEGDGATP